MPSIRAWRFKFGYWPNDEWFVLPRCGLLNIRAENFIHLGRDCFLGGDGEMTAYVHWLWFEVAARLKTRRAKGIKGVV